MDFRDLRYDAEDRVVHLFGPLAEKHDGPDPSSGEPAHLEQLPYDVEVEVSRQKGVARPLGRAPVCEVHGLDQGERRRRGRQAKPLPNGVAGPDRDRTYGHPAVADGYTLRDQQIQDHRLGAEPLP